MIMMDGIKLSVTKFEEMMVKGTPDHTFCGILKREFKHKKLTLSEWRALIEEIKARPAK